MLKSAFSWVLHQPLAIINQDDDYFRLALEQAHFASGTTHPNPSVGAVIVHEGQLLRGFTEAPGGMHAEKQAIHHAKTDLKGATLYVTLEPCCHTGRTPPCTDAIIKAGISRVVYGVRDPNPLVAGKGLLLLEAAGIKVEQIKNPALGAQARDILKPFTKYIIKKKPYVVLKIATTKDLAVAYPGKRTKITGPESDRVVHQLRRAVDAVMVGANTVRIDNPSLLARLGDEKHGGQPVRVILSSDLNFDPKLAIFQTKLAETWIFCASKTLGAQEQFTQRGVKIFSMKALSLPAMLDRLAQEGIMSVLVEPGPKLLKSFIRDALADEIWWFKSNSCLGPPATFISEALGELALPAEFLALGQDQLVIKSACLDDL